jgi:hypothetical protein
MLLEAEERAADLAVSRYGADAVRVQALVRAVREARARGDALDLLDLMERDRLLTADQLGDLRFGLANTHIDPTAPHRNGNGQPAAPPAAEPGDDALSDLRALGDYRILRRLGEGGMGAVFLAFHEHDQQQVAIKVLSSQLAQNQGTLDRFYREAKSGALLNHPHIVRNHSVGQDRATGLHYLVLEFIDGGNAHQLLERLGRLPVGDAVHVVLDIARALEHAHSRSIVHRDIKPGNILVTKSGLAKLSDLGLAKRTDEASHLTLTRQGFGTPYYMPYEQAMNARRADARSDIYALGATLYHLVTGDVPFPGANALEIVDKKGLGEFLPASLHNPAASPELDRILSKMMARDPQDRYQTASELIVELERSGLAAAVPSFVEETDVLNDPLMRERLTAPAQATVLDVRQAGVADVFWYVLYRDGKGRLRKAKLTTALVRERLVSSKLTAQAKAARTPKGPFMALYAIADFDDLAPPPVLRAPRKRPTLTPSSDEADTLARRWWTLSIVAAVAVLAVVSWAVVAWSG